jgi:enoyl-CoA hydratase/carnithine racemase
MAQRMDTSFAIECPPFEVKLSHWDRILPPTHSKRILCFSLPSNIEKEKVVDYLHIAFHHTIQRVPFLAGSVVPFSSDQGGRPWLRNIVPEGSAKLIVKDLSDELSFSYLEKLSFPQHLLKTEQLCPLPEVGYFKNERVDVCQFQANFIEGGLLLVVSIIHNAADGRGVTEIIKIFSEELRKAQSGETQYPLHPRTELYRSDRTAVVSGDGNPGNIENHAAWTSSPSNAHSQIHNVENSCQTFRISANALADLKKILDASSQGSTDWFSTNDAISGFIWCSIMIARHRAGILDTNALTHVAQPLDCRAHLKIPMPYFGNVIYMAQSSVPLSKLMDRESGLATAARALRAEIKAMTGTKFRDLIGYAERTELEAHTRLKIIEHMSTSGIILTSLYKMDLHAMDFGPLFGDGYIKALRLPARGTQAGAVIVLPKVPDGSCEFMVTEQESTIKCLMEDPFFSRFTQLEDTISGHPDQELPPLQQPQLVTDRKAIPADPLSVTVASAATQAQDLNLIPALASLPEPAVNEDEKVISITPNSDALKSVTEKLQDIDLIPAIADKKLSTLVVSRIKAFHVGTIKIIQLQRPKARNAISRLMLEELSQEIDEIHDEKDSGGTRALILASAVDDIFCAGADLKERKHMSPAETQEFLTSLRTVFTRLATLPIPSIACVSGGAFGGGLELALCCHFRVFSSNAAVALPETRLAIIPGAGGTYRLPKIVGISHALDLILTGRTVQANEAFAMGLCNRLVAGDEVDSTLSSSSKRDMTLEAGIVLAEQLSNCGPVAVRAAISALSYTSEAAENAAYDSVLITKDRTEALEAFSQKRKPVLSGK